MFYFQDVLKLLSARVVCSKIICFKIICKRCFISHKDVLDSQNMKLRSCKPKNIVMLSFSEIFKFDMKPSDRHNLHEINLKILFM